ncbi:hypothetical protein P875_00053013 [Aspergillus parasiticus SU-1]|uniref:Ricin B lectin domain-containing protein n=1 Tax=Aspergillus parasiticus (strain ATCC 56775 / NRRL 5862 / SRRC 143 / SU-1) TaxID=1403190 RepID=A0A0F0I286_ASPPU|nr:hypothetical protein P875_00053013 [Aspergillus parasiticus SU-1]
MKAFTIFGFVVMLSSQALALQLDGTFTVASVSDPERYLKEDGSGKITFSEESPQGWSFVEAEKDRYKIANTVTNHYISCGSAEDDICGASDKAQLFQIHNDGDNVYSFVDAEDSLPLYAGPGNHLVLASSDFPPPEYLVFKLTKV